MKNSSSPSLSHDAIVERSHTIWIHAGGPEGQELEHWLQAETELQTERRHTEEAESQRSTAGAAPGSASEEQPVGAGGRAGSATPFRRAGQRAGGDSRKSNGR